MTNDDNRAARRADYFLRDAIIELLSDDEGAKVSNAEATLRLNEGDDFIDLEHLDRGVGRADGIVIHMGSVLPRKAVHAGTWERIVGLIEAPPREPPGTRHRTRPLRS